MLDLWVAIIIFLFVGLIYISLPEGKPYNVRKTRNEKELIRLKASLNDIDSKIYFETDLNRMRVHILDRDRLLMNIKDLEK